MGGAICIEIRPLGFVDISLTQPKDEATAERLWRLYRSLRPQIATLKQAARREGAVLGAVAVLPARQRDDARRHSGRRVTDGLP